MNRPLTPARFAELAEAYGSVVARWPEAVRGEAMVMARNPAMQAILDDAGWLDDQLDVWRVPAPSEELRRQVLASRKMAVARRLQLWWSGIGIATALAGAVAGTVGVAVAMPSDHSLAEEATVFGDVTPQER